MALIRSKFVVKDVVFVIPRVCRYFCDRRIISIQVDALDDFTTQLLQKKVNKWENCKQQKASPNNYNTGPVLSDISNLNQEGINPLFNKYIEDNNDEQAIALMKQCIKQEISPTFTHIIFVLNRCSQKGDKETIASIQKLCERTQPNFLNVNSYFNHFMAEATWIKGNIKKSLEMFEETYRNNVYLRRRIRFMLKFLTADIVNQKSEAVLINIIEFCQKLATEFKDYYPLTCIWRSCFLSEWYSDQCRAKELLEKNEALIKTISNQIPFIISLSLRNQQTDTVYRLLEVLLKYNLKSHVPAVVLTLFDYQSKFLLNFLLILHYYDILPCIIV